MRHALRVGLVLVLIIPYLILLANMDRSGPIDLMETAHVLKATVLQGFLSAFCAVVLGTVGALGILSRWVHRKQLWLWALICLLPTFVPSIVVALSLLNLVRPFPFGLWGVVLAHVIMNTGLVSWNLSVAIRRKIVPLYEVARTCGATPWTFWRWAGVRELQSDLIQQFILVFALAATAFVTPLMLSGPGNSYSLEVLIYEKIRISGQLEAALTLTWLQSFLIAVLSITSQRSWGARWISTEAWNDHTRLGKTWALVVPVSACGALAAGLLSGLDVGAIRAQAADLTALDIPLLTVSSLALGLYAAITAIVFLCGIAMAGHHRVFEWFLQGAVMPGPILLGFSLILLSLRFGVAVLPETSALVLAGVGCGLLSVPLLYRWRWRNRLHDLSPQVEVARSLGAGPTLIFSHIVFPLAAADLGFLAGLAGFWAVGDFGLSAMLLNRDVTWALVAQNLMASYRLELATAVTGGLLVLGLFVFLFLWGMGHVFGAKSRSLV